MPTVAKTFYFAYSHRLQGHPGLCKNYHGHNGKAEIRVNDQVNHTTGMVIDFDDISQTVGKWIKENLDHSSILQVGDPLLEGLPGHRVTVLDGPPTAENIGLLILVKARNFLNIHDISVKVWETDDCWAEVP